MEGRERRGSPVTGPWYHGTMVPANLSSAVHYWNATISYRYLRDALLVQVPTGELTGVGLRKGNTCTRGSGYTFLSERLQFVDVYVHVNLRHSCTREPSP
jgi:hypothetical protein